MSFLFWLDCLGSLPRCLMPGTVLPGLPIVPRTRHATSRATLPRACLFPHSILKAFQWLLSWGGSAGRGGLCDLLSAPLCPQLSLVPPAVQPLPCWWWGPTCSSPVVPSVSCIHIFGMLFPPCQPAEYFSKLILGITSLPYSSCHSQDKLNHFMPTCYSVFFINMSAVYFIYLFTWLWQWDLNSTPEHGIFPSSYCFWMALWESPNLSVCQRACLMIGGQIELSCYTKNVIIDKTNTQVSLLWVILSPSRRRIKVSPVSQDGRWQILYLHVEPNTGNRV